MNAGSRQCGLHSAKVAMMEGGVIASDFSRHPVPPLPDETRAEPLGLPRHLEPTVLRWGPNAQRALGVARL